MIQKITTVILRDLGYKSFCVSYVLICDKEMRKLNRKYRKINKTTDVLSFPQYKFLNGDLLEPIPVMEEKIPLGDIVISLETLRRRSRDKKSFSNYLLKTVIHGILHLIGFDHKSKRDREIMRENERILFNLYKEGFEI